MRYTYMLNMDNEKAESCDVVVKFRTDAFERFDGFTSIHSNNLELVIRASTQLPRSFVIYERTTQNCKTHSA